MNSTRSLFRRGAAVAAVCAASVALAACGSTDHDGHRSASASASATASVSASQGEHNAADVAFAQGMIPHHRQAVEMADLASGRAGSGQVKKLAADIKKAQDPEIRTLSAWLTSWGESVPSQDAMDHSTHGMDGMDGMMTGQDMAELEETSGTAFDTAFLQMMIKHHEGAVKMAKTEKTDGAYAPATKMADRIITSQSEEINTMNELLNKS
ncbi:DUF305 domain-containing protein [Streptomyces sp. MMBL 11-3]|uniref:DUF305 domain-containing protein n=1 Tax=Streptomyces sp. MMBL 11-3 TaxID=3382639 RepID=UPI0039B40725